MFLFECRFFILEILYCEGGCFILEIWFSEGRYFILEI
jgi:hypothetical protein